MVDPALMERTADAILAVVVEQDMPLDKVRRPNQLPCCRVSAVSAAGKGTREWRGVARFVALVSWGRRAA